MGIWRQRQTGWDFPAENMHPTFIQALAVMWQGCLGDVKCSSLQQLMRRVPCSHPHSWISALVAQDRGNHSLNQTPVLWAISQDHNCGKALRVTGKTSSLQEMHYRSSHLEGSWLHLLTAAAKADSVNLKLFPRGVSLHFIISKKKSSLLWATQTE